jgi:hypothetical protein
MRAQADRRRGGGSASGALEALVFLAFVGVGAAYIVWAKLSGLPPAAVTMLPVAVMVAYAASVLFIRPMRVGEDHGGDNVYYMGFLFTLTSLSVSLWQFDADGAAEEIVRNFGIAVASTIAGIALRIFMNQLRREAGVVERSARMDLADAARRVRRELDATVLEIGHFRRGTQQAAAESWTAVREEVSDTARGVVEDLRAATVPISRAARRSSGEIRGLAANIEALNVAMEGFTRRLDAAIDPGRMVDERITPVVAPLADMIERLGEKLDAHADRLAAVAETLAAFERRLAAARPPARSGREPVDPEPGNLSGVTAHSDGPQEGAPHAVAALEADDLGSAPSVPGGHEAAVADAGSRESRREPGAPGSAGPVLRPVREVLP